VVWLAFLTNHTQVLLCISREPGIRLRELGTSIGITERAAHRILAELIEQGYVTRERVGRRNYYTVDPDRSIEVPVAPNRNIGELIAFFDGNGRRSRRRASVRS
jgi:predicted ArsR family transcriptional regulator